jgi:hypothetical protein
VRSLLLALGLGLIAPASASGQGVGDSVRVRVSPSTEWIQGHLLSLDSSRVAIRQLDNDQSWALDSVSRLEVWNRRDSRVTLVVWTLSGAIGFGVCAAVRCGGYPPLTGSVGGAIGVGAGVGLFLGFLDLQISPGQWNRVRLAVGP